MILLNRIIRQVNKPIRQILHIELFARRPNIPILVPIALHASINWRYQYVRPDVEFSLLVQERDDVFLDDVGAGLTLTALLRLVDDVMDFLESLDYDDAVASVGVFARFHEPCITTLWLEPILNLVVGVGFLVLLFLLNFILPLVVLNQEIIKLLIPLLLNMERHRNIDKRIFFSGLVVSLQIHE